MMMTDPLIVERIKDLEVVTKGLEQALEAQEEISREQEKDIVTLKLQVAGLFDRITGTVPTVSETVSTD